MWLAMVRIGLVELPMPSTISSV